MMHVVPKTYCKIPGKNTERISHRQSSEAANQWRQGDSGTGGKAQAGDAWLQRFRALKTQKNTDVKAVPPLLQRG